MKPYVITKHAIDQAVERLEQPRFNAKNYLTQLMQTAVYVGNDGRGRVFDHYVSRTRLILAKETDKVITVYSMDSRKPTEITREYIEGNVFLSTFQATVKRELSKARRQFIRESRRITEEIAVIGVEIARLTLNKARARSPITQGHIQRKIDDLHAEAVRKDGEKGELEAQFRAMKSEVSEFVTE